MCVRNHPLDALQPYVEMKPGDQVIEVDGHNIIVNPGSGVLDFSQQLLGVPMYDPSLSFDLDPETGELVTFKDGKEIRRDVCDLEPLLPFKDEDQLHAALVDGHLDLTKCYDGPGRQFGSPPKFKSPMFPVHSVKVSSLTLTEHHCPPDKKDDK